MMQWLGKVSKVFTKFNSILKSKYFLKEKNENFEISNIKSVLMQSKEMNTYQTR